MYKSTDYVEIVNSKTSKYRKKCEYCGHTISFYSFENDVKLCNYCGKYNFKNEKIKFNYLLKRKISRIS